jgi:hypothetical protein
MKVLAALAVALAAMAQTPPSDPSACLLSGVVKEAATHVPLEGVRVWAGQSDATTGPQGQFTFRKLEPGRHWISVEDRSRAAAGGTYVLLNSGQDLTGVEIYIKTGGSISGRVFDADRQPVAGAAVILLEAAFEMGQTAYRSRLAARTGHDGEYRLEPVPAGRGFLILVNQPVKPPNATDPIPADPEKRPRIPAPVFYPGSPDIEGGQVVTILSGEDRRGVDIQMASAPWYCIDGAMDPPKGVAAPEVTITEQLPRISGSWIVPVTAAVSNGHFHACGFHPGEYRVEAAGTKIFSNRRWSAFAQVAIADRDAREVQLVPGSAVTLAGDTVWEPPRQDAVRARIAIALTKLRDKHAEEAQSSALGTSFGYGTHIQVPGPFALEGMPADDYIFDVQELPEGCYVNDATLAGASVWRQPLRLTQAAGDGRLHIALACDGGSLMARVTDRDGNPVSNVNLYVMPEEAGTAAALYEVLRQAEVEKGFSGTVKPLPPGKYLVLACDLRTDGTADPILKLWSQRAKATEVEIGAGQIAQVTLELADID